MDGLIASRKTLLLLIAVNAIVYLFYVRVYSGRSLDFQVFYFAGETAIRAPGQLYDLNYQRRTEQAEFGDLYGANYHFVAFIHPPQEVLIFLPFSRLPFVSSLNAWRLFSLLCLVVSGVLLARATGMDPVTVTLLASATYPVGMCLFLGQDSLLLLLLVCWCFYLLRKERDVAAAAVLSMALFKPQLPVILAIAVLAVGRKRFFAWFAGFGIILAAASIAFVGRAGLLNIFAGERLSERGVVFMPTIRGLVASAGGDHRWLAWAIFFAAMVAMFPMWRRSRSLEFSVASAICLGCAFMPYIYAYDLVLLAIPLALIAQRPRKRDGLVGALLTSALLLNILDFLKAPAVLVIPTIALGVMTFRLASSTRTTLPALTADAGTD